MGCASSKGDINDQHPNIFQVMNVDEDFHAISPGQIEITDTELVFHQRGKLPTRWSLRNLRKYGFDSEIFSFECGRRCVTGPGIFAFKCRKAEQLFNLLQHNIQVRNMSEEVSIPLSELTISAPVALQQMQQIQIQRRSTPEGYLNPVNSRPTLSRPGSITSNGPTSPTSVSTPPVEDNNNKRMCLEHSYLNTEALHMIEANPSYINITQMQPNEQIVENGPSSRLYMNIDTSTITTIQENAKENEQDQDICEVVNLPLADDDPIHNYANIDTNLPMQGHLDESLSVPATPTEVNYVELDLGPSGKSVAQPLPESPHKTKSYVTIDFHKTNALSQSINPRLDFEEGCRKTRHNSIFGEVRHSSSISD